MIYKVGYHTYEESYYLEFFHEKLFSQEELKEIVFNCLLKIFPQEKKICDKSNKESKKLAKEENLIHDEKWDLKVSFQDLFHNENFVKEMKKKDFSLIKYDGDLSFFGWASVEENDWTNHTDDLTQEAQKWFKKKIAPEK